MSEFLNAALLYASLGWRVFPLMPKSKDPATPHGFHDATTDVDKIKQWWAVDSRYNVGIATGEGLCVIDVDDKPDKHAVLGSDMLRDWELDHGDISETICAKTGTGGMHYYFDVGNTKIQSCQSDTIFIDLRCDGGYIVAPPSIHPDTGMRYEWDISPEDMPPTKASDVDKACIQWVYNNRRGADKDGKRDKVKLPTKRVKDGEGRNNFLYEQGCSARGKGSDDETIAAWLSTLNAMKCDPPLGQAELDKIINSVCSLPVGMSDEAKELQQQKKPVGRPRKFDHVAIGDKLIQQYNACIIDGMPAVQNGKVYELGWRAINRAIVEIQKDATRANQMEVHHYLLNIAPEIEQSPPNLIAFENGVLNIETMELLPFTPNMVIPNIIPHNWNPSATSAAVNQVFENISCGDIGMMLNLAEVIGLAMFRSCKFAVCPILLGEGSNGKSTYIDMVRKVIGRHNVSALHPRDIGKRFQAGQLVGKLANLGDDISNEYVDGDACASIKAIAAGNEIYTDVKGGDGFTFKPYCLSVFSANKFPRLADTSYGMMRRLFPMGFHADFKASSDSYDINIIDKVTSQESLEYLCLIGVEGLKRVIDQNGLTENEESKQINQTVKLENSTVLQWLDACELRPQDITGRTSNDVHEEYSKWCRDHNLKPVGPRSMSTTFKTEWNIKLEHLEHFMVDGKRSARRVFDFSD